ncbi:MAG: alpha/beta fold hydrolase [Sphingomonadales bacterium]|nr:alpha/beta fold hydrolase [Sphingomonadales bacterium]
MSRKVILLHGYGGSGAELLDAFAGLTAAGYDCWAPDAPHRCELLASGYQWFGLTKLGPQLAERVCSAGNDLITRLPGGEWREGPILIGHSQGAMLAAYLALSGHLGDGSAICVSGLLTCPADMRANAEGCLTFIHGQQDDMIPLSDLHGHLAEYASPAVCPRVVVVKDAGHALIGSLVDAAISAVHHLGLRSR